MADKAFRRISIDNHGDWLIERNALLQASDAAAVMGISPWKSMAELYDEKTGRIPAKDISDKPYVRYGVDMEPIARSAFMLDCPYFTIEYHQYDILESLEFPWMGATLDGELTVVSPMNPWGLPAGAKGVYEGKTGGWTRESDLAEWDGTRSYVPPHYFAQGIHQLNVTGWDFVIFHARLKRDPYRDSDMGFPEIRTFYRILDCRSYEVENAKRVLKEAEQSFWDGYVRKGKRPSRRIAI